VLPPAIIATADRSARIAALVHYDRYCVRQYELARAKQPRLSRLIGEILLFALGVTTFFGSLTLGDHSVIAWVLVAVSAIAIVGSLIFIVLDIRAYEVAQERMTHWSNQIRDCSQALRDLREEESANS
jgi:cytochrome c biogenesis protein CcdA